MKTDKEIYYAMVVRLHVLLVFVFLCAVNYGSAFPSAQTQSWLQNTAGLPPENISLSFSREAALETSAPGAIEGDILPPDHIEGRKVTKGWGSLWPADRNGVVTVPYTIGDSRLDEDEVRRAIKFWTDSTCIQFEEVSTSYSGYHLIFIQSFYCASYVGRYGSRGQEVHLHPSCLTIIMKAVHEIGHALGFYHEQSRSDRDDYVRILYANIESGREYNFDRHSTNNKGVPYDYSSMMHYGNRFFAKNTAPTIVSVDPLMMSVMDNREKISFMDVKLANIVYKCIDRWQKDCEVPASQCLNDGYVGSTCECVCPDGTSGDQCENLDMEYNDAVLLNISPLSEKIYDPCTISSPGYPTPLQNKTVFMKIFIAPPNHKVKLVIQDFDLYRKLGTECSLDFLAIYPSIEMDQETTACGTELKNGTEFLSESNTLILEFSSYQFSHYGSPNGGRGFLATVSHVPTDNTTLFVDSQKGGCRMLITDTLGEYLFQNPDYPLKYGSFYSCSLKVSTAIPSYLRMSVLDIELGWFDVVKAKFDLIDFRTYGFNRETRVRLVPTSHVALEFWSWPLSSGIFNIQVDVLSSDCHKIIELKADDTGVLTLPSTYEPDTICEWWLVAPDKMKIQLRMEENFYIMSDNFHLLCFGDYLVVNKRGSRRYGRDSETLCGSYRPKSIISDDNKMNILFNGIKGGSNNFEGRYSLI